MTKPKVVSMVAERFLRLIPGSDRCHATFNPDPATFVRDDKTGKLTPKYRLVDQPVTVDLWERHLAGTYPLVVALACDDHTTRCSVVDVDDYSVNPLALVERINSTGLPLYVRRSKSGGAHVFAFHDRPVSIEQSEEISTGIARVLGLSSKIELFPRVQEPDAKPLQLNMPFCGDSGCFIKVTGAAMLPDEFLNAVKCITDEQRASLAKEKEKAEETPPTSDSDGAEFAQRMLNKYCAEMRKAKEGDPAIKLKYGGRNNMLTAHAFHLGTMIPRGWIDESTVTEKLGIAVMSWGEESRQKATLLSQVKAGQRKPHADLRQKADDLTEDSAALEFAERFADELRYDHDAGAWFQFAGSHWRQDQTSLAFSWARDLARELSAGKAQKIIGMTSKASFAGSVERYAKSDRALVATQALWDNDKLLLGTPDGTVDLRTGELRPALPSDYITKLTAVSPAATADCPLWLEFLDQATSGDAELIQFLQVLNGYSLTGLTVEHLLIFIFGSGGNGKGVYLNTIGGLMHDYHKEAPMDCFTESKNDRHPADLAMLRGARLVTSAETTEGRSWEETRIKQLTGGDPITARFMRRNFFTYVPELQLQIVGNHKPKLHNVSDAMRRRLALVPFNHKPPKPDRKLVEKLKAEWPGILRWMIDGCIEWQKNGITLPDVVLEANEEYFNEQDLIGQWIAKWVERTKVNTSRETDVALLEFMGQVRQGRWRKGRR